ncbi:MAG: DMT family transporter [Clostridium sp.]
MWGIIIALISGALMSLQGVFNTEVTKQTGIWVSAGWVQLSALVMCIVMWLFTGRSDVGKLVLVTPKYMLLGGIMGAFITYTVIKSMGSLGPAKAALLIVVAQLLVAYGIEVWGLFGVEQVGFEWRKAIGGVIAIAGIIIFRY